MSAGARTPPRLAEWLLARFVPPGVVGHTIIGDCREEYAEFLRTGSWVPGAVWYWGHVVRIIARLISPSRRDSLGVRGPKRGLGDRVNQTLRFSVRSLLHRKGFAAVAVATLAVGIGATTATFTLAEYALLRSLPFPDADRLVALYSFNPERGLGMSNVSYPDFEDWRTEGDIFVRAAVYRVASLDLAGGTAPERIRVTRAGTDFFSVLETRPILGRVFDASDHDVGNPNVIVLDEGLWSRRYGADPSIVGQTVRLDGAGYSVVGVVGADGHWPMGADAWIPQRFPGGQPTRRSNHSWSGIARLRPDVTTEAAGARMSELTRRARMDETYLATDPFSDVDRGVQSTTVSLARSLAEDELRIVFVVLVGAVLSVLLIACINVSNLFLTQASIRGREMAIRSALGAPRRRIVAQLMTESVLVALAGGALGIAFAQGALALVAQFAPAEAALPALAPSPVVLMLALACSLVASVVSGLAPAIQGARANATDALKESSGQTTSTAGAQRTRRFLVGFEVALSMVLLIAAGLMIRSVQHMLRADPGFEVENVLTFRVNVPAARYPNIDDVERFYNDAISRLTDVPTVEAASVSSTVPIGGGLQLFRVFLGEGDPEPPAGPDHGAMWYEAGPGYLEILGVSLLDGRFFTELDRRTSAPVIVVNESMARRLADDGRVLGKRIRSWRDENVYREIVGVVPNMAISSLVRAEQTAVFVPVSQSTRRGNAFLVRTMGDPDAALPGVRTALAGVDDGIAMAGTTTLQDVLEVSAGSLRFIAAILSAFGAIALVLAIVGVYGLTAFSVAQRTHEIGIRMALGGQGNAVQWFLVRQSGRSALIGGVVGLVGSFIMAQVVGAQVAGTMAVGVDGRTMGMTDPVAFLATGLLLAGVGLVAAYIPARRATKVDPVTTLRVE
jgi:putative ABC transport system permease protein